MAKFRDGTVSEYDSKCLNDKIWIGNRKYQKDSDLPDNMKYVTYKNKNRDSINTALFEKAMMTSADPNFGLLVFASKVKIRDSMKNYSNLNNWGLLWKNVSESDLNFGNQSKRMDPVLKIYKGM